MRELKKLVDEINEELEGIEDYLCCAAKAKAEGRHDDYNDYMSLATAEMEHPPKLHKIAVLIIDRWKTAHPDAVVPEYMTEMWDEAHANYMECFAKLKYKMELVKME